MVRLKMLIENRKPFIFTVLSHWSGFWFGCRFFLSSTAILGCIWLLLADWLSGNRKQSEIKVNRSPKTSDKTRQI